MAASVMGDDRNTKRGGAAMTIGLAAVAAVLAIGGWQLCERQEQARPEATGAPSQTAPVSSEASAPPVVASAPSAAPKIAEDAGNCRALAWKDSGLFAQEDSFDGTIRKGTGFDANMHEEKFLTLVLDMPVCAEDGTPVRQMQIFEDADPDTRDAGLNLGPLFGRKVTLEGEPMAQHTAHHHTPVLLAVKKARTR